MDKSKQIVVTVAMLAALGLAVIVATKVVSGVGSKAASHLPG